jgi:hypothetical protein
MQCFTGVEPFVPWSRIFGAKWVNDRQAEKVGAATRDIYFDGHVYWRKVEGRWVERSRQDLLLFLKSAGLSIEGVPNEMEAALITIQDERQVYAAVPLVGHPEGIVPVMGMKYLNTSGVQPIAPADGEGEWGEGFPLLADFLGGLLALVEDEDIQTPFFLAWVQRYYKATIQKKPVPGQVIFLAGEVEQGKTFTSNVILSRLMGGSVDASSFLLGETTFTGHLFGSPLWTVDDTLAGHDRSHAYYSSMIKKMPANQLFLFNEKYKKAKVLPWLGRVVVTCNLDDESMRIIPNAEQSLLDKIMLFKIQTRDGVDFQALYDALPDELPCFARWLLSWDPTVDGVLEYSRYGITAYHHPELLESARSVMPSYSFYELLVVYLEGYFKEYPKQLKWCGTPTQLVREMTIDDSLKNLIAQYSPRSVGRFLAQLKNQGYPLTQWKINYQRIWHIDRAILQTTPGDPTPLRDKKS